MRISEKAVPAEEIAELTAFAESVYVLLAKEKPNADPIDVIDEILYVWQQSGTIPVAELESNQLIYALGTLWGNILIKQYHWSWATLTFHEFNDWEGRAVVAADGSLCILPFAYIHICLAGDDEVKISASLVALGANIIPSFPPNSFEDVMNGLQRIVPRG